MRKEFDIIDLNQTDHIPQVQEGYDDYTEEYINYTEEYSDDITNIDHDETDGGEVYREGTADTDESYITEEYPEAEAQEEEYVQEEYTAEEYVDGEYINEEYVNEEYINEGYDSEEYINEENINEEYINDEFANEEYMDEYTSDEGYVDGYEMDDSYDMTGESYDPYDEENAGMEVFQGEVSVDTMLMSDISEEINEHMEEQYTGSVDFVGLDDLAEESYGSEEYYDPEGVYDSEESYYAGEGTYDGDEAYDNEERQDFKSRILAFFRNFTAGDWVTAGMGALIVCVAIITLVAVGNRNRSTEAFNLYDVGQNFSSIGIAGESGLMAMANAQMAAPMEEEDGTAEFVSVEVKCTSVERDLKIKFVDTATDRLITDVEFEIILKIDGKEAYRLKDEDLDGIIYDKTVAPGVYQVEVVPVEGYEFTDIPSSVTVKDQIVYEQIDVTEEIKSESEINAAEEDTAINNAPVEEEPEPTLSDTVEWVESTKVPVGGSDGYRQVDKNTIAEPSYSARNTVDVASEQRAAEPMRPYFIMHELFRSASGNTVSGGNAQGSVSGNEGNENEGTKPEERTVSVTISGEKTVQVDGTITLAASAKYDGSAINGGTYSWKSSNESVATVNGGKVSALKEGTATITVEFSKTDGNITYKGSATWEITVEKKAVVVTVSQVSVSPATLDLSVSESKVVTATAVMTDQTKVTTASAFSFQSSDAKIATVDASGKVTGVAAGTATITVSYKDAQGNTKSASCTVKVTQPTMQGIALNQTSLTLRKGTSETLTATVTLSNGTKITDAGKMTWKSSNTSVATVDAAGKVTAVANGTAKITVTYKDAAGNTKSVECTVKVVANPEQDTSSKLVDKNGNQVYVKNSSGNYVEATFADYYKASTFYIKADVEYLYTGWQTINGNVYYFDKNHNKVTGDQVIQGIKYHFTSDGILAMNNNGVLGIDVSKWNGSIDWNAVKNSGINFVIIRCGYRGSSTGVLVEDPTFRRNIQGASAAGLKVGVYFFTQAINEVEAVEEASMVLSLIKGYSISYPVFIDTEQANGRADGLSRAARTAVCRAFCETIRNAGYSAGVYASKSWYNDNLNYGSLSGYRIWLAQYRSEPTFGNRYDMWQYTDKGTVNGISGKVDMNISYLGY